MGDKDVVDAISFVREIVRLALWETRYHKMALARVYKNAVFAREMMERGKFNKDIERAEGDEDGDATFTSVEQFACHVLDEAEDQIKWHERALIKSHDKVAFAMIMLARGEYSEIDVADIQKQVDKDD